MLEVDRVSGWVVLFDGTKEVNDGLLVGFLRFRWLAALCPSLAVFFIGNKEISH